MVELPESLRPLVPERLEVPGAPAEPLFDSLADLAAQTFGTPIGVISLVDSERQWIKDPAGLDLDHAQLNRAFCQHATASDGVFRVCDAAEDERFRDHLLVTGPPHVRFYAGVALRTPEGVLLGTLCVIDTAVREFSDADAARLQLLAMTVVQALVLRLDSRESDRLAAVAAKQTSLLKLAEEMAGVGTWSWDVAEDRTVWSDQTHRIHGYEPSSEAPPLQGVLERYHPDDAKFLADCVQRAIAEGLDYALEARIYRPDGTERHVIARGACRKDAAGKVFAIDGTFQDVTELVAAEQFIRTLTDNLPGLIAYWDSDLRCRFANAAYGEWFGRTPESMLQLTLPELLGPELAAKNDQYIRGVLSGQRQGFSRTLVKASGELGHTYSHYIPDIDASGRTQGFYVLVSDVTDLKRAQETLQETNRLLAVARDQAEAATAVKTEFLANMSHEIRTPLTTIIGFTGLLAGRNDLTETAQLMVSRVKGASMALLSLVNDILDFSRLETGQMTVEPAPVEVAAFAQDVLALFGPQAEAKSLRLEFDASPDIPDRVSVDPDRLRQILLNLIGNAVKFTDQGFVRLGLAYDVGKQVLEVRVEDSGIGMDETQRTRLFQRFSQVDASSTRRHGGTGLGLAICRGLVSAMGGEIGVESAPGQGSVFHFQIAAPTVSEPIQLEQHAAGSATLGGLRVLVADDHPANRELARALLENFDAEVREAVDGAEAVALAMSLPFDVLLIDLHMPVLDGEGALQQIRA